MTAGDESKFHAAKIAQAVKGKLHPGRLITVEGSPKLHAIAPSTPTPQGAVALRNGFFAAPVDDGQFDAAIDDALTEHGLTADEGGRQEIVDTVAALVRHEKPADWTPERTASGFNIL